MTMPPGKKAPALFEPDDSGSRLAPDKCQGNAKMGHYWQHAGLAPGVVIP